MTRAVVRGDASLCSQHGYYSIYRCQYRKFGRKETVILVGNEDLARVVNDLVNVELACVRCVAECNHPSLVPLRYIMALVTFSGYPCSGKTRRAAQLKGYLESRLADPSYSGPLLKVIVLSDDTLNIDRSSYDGIVPIQLTSLPLPLTMS
jgi:hypothetical protein